MTQEEYDRIAKVLRRVRPPDERTALQRMTAAWSLSGPPARIDDWKVTVIVLASMFKEQDRHFRITRFLEIAGYHES